MKDWPPVQTVWSSTLRTDEVAVDHPACPPASWSLSSLKRLPTAFGMDSSTDTSAKVHLSRKSTYIVYISTISHALNYLEEVEQK